MTFVIHRAECHIFHSFLLLLVGGERTGMRKTTKYYDVQKEYERLKDLGSGSKISIFELLSLLDEKVSFDRYDLMDNSSLIERLNAEANEVNNNSPSGSAAKSNTANSKANDQQKKERMSSSGLMMAPRQVLLLKSFSWMVMEIR